MDVKKRNADEKRVFNLIYPSTCLSEKELAANLGISIEKASSMMNRLTESGDLKTFSGSDIDQIARANGIYIKRPKTFYITPAGNLEIAKNKELVRIVSEKIEEDYANIDREIARISGESPFHALDYPMELLEEARQKDSKKLEDFVMIALDYNMRINIHRAEKRIDEIESLREQLEKFQKSNQCF